MKVLVVGGNGFLGAHAAARLSRDGHRVAAVVHEETWRLKLVCPEAQLISDSSLSDLSGADVVVVFAGTSTPAAFTADSLQRYGEEIDIHRRLLLAAQRADSRPLFLVAGSRTQYGIPTSLPVGEDAPAQPNSLYALEKTHVDDLYELAFQQAGIPSLRLRLTNPYGPFEWSAGRRHGLVSMFAEQALSGGRITVFGDGEQTRDYVHVDDVSELVSRIATSSFSESAALNVGSGIGTAIADLAVLVSETIRSMGHDCTVEHVEMPPASSSIETGAFVAQISRASKLFDWRPEVPLSSGLQQAIRVDGPRIQAAAAA